MFTPVFTEKQDSQEHRRRSYMIVNPQSETATPLNTRDNQISIANARKLPTETKGTRDHLNQVLKQLASLGFPNNPEKQDLNEKPQPKMLIEDVKKDIKTL